MRKLTPVRNKQNIVKNIAVTYRKQCLEGLKFIFTSLLKKFYDQSRFSGSVTIRISERLIRIKRRI